jgi:hypothetical protein
LRARQEVQPDRLVVIASSFGGMALLAAEHEGLAAAVDFAGGASQTCESNWNKPVPANCRGTASRHTWAGDPH